MINYNQSQMMNELRDIKKQIKKNEEMIIEKLSKISDAIQRTELDGENSDKQK